MQDCTSLFFSSIFPSLLLSTSKKERTPLIIAAYHIKVRRLRRMLQPLNGQQEERVLIGTVWPRNKSRRAEYTSEKTLHIVIFPHGLWCAFFFCKEVIQMWVHAPNVSGLGYRLNLYRDSLRVTNSVVFAQQYSQIYKVDFHRLHSHHYSHIP